MSVETSFDPDETVELLHRARVTGDLVTDLAIPALDPRTGHALQLRVAERFLAAGLPIGGWKVGLTSGAVRDSMGPGVRPFGFILKDRIFDSGASVELSGVHDCSVEPEVVLVLGEDLNGPGLTRDDALGAVSGAGAAFEINETRLSVDARENPGLLIADGLIHWGVVIGDIASDIQSIAGLEAVLEQDGIEVDRTVAGASLEIDDPFASLARLCNDLSEYGRFVRAGEYVITGAFTRKPVLRSSTWRATFSSIGSVSVEFN